MYLHSQTNVHAHAYAIQTVIVKYSVRKRYFMIEKP